ncbi:MAG TPA: BON domain-containing protein [Terriglobia bacterium]|nr:BON domain-containing protein [Terriglobia bacterium]
MWLASSLLGSRVRNSAGQSLGKIDDIVIDPSTGTILHVVLSYGGFLGIGRKLVSIPWSSPALSPRNYVVLDSNRETIARAPAFHRVVDHAPREPRKPLSLFGAVALVLLLLAGLWVAFLVGTRGWDEARNEIGSTFQSVAYAMKESSKDAALTAKVKTALSLSKRVPADQINVDSEDGVVTLRGEVPSEEIRRLAESVARDTPGVSDVQNHLYVVGRSQ